MTITSIGPTSKGLAVAVSMLGLAGGAILLASWERHNRAPRNPRQHEVSLPGRIELGLVKKGGRGETRVCLSVKNDLSWHCRFRTSCPCLKVIPSEIFFGKDKTGWVELSLDLSDEPDFSGSLAIEIIGEDEAEREVFRSNVTVEVK